MLKKVLFVLFAVCFSAMLYAGSSSYDAAKKLYDSGDFVGAAVALGPSIDDGTAGVKELILYGNALEGLTESINTDAEKVCYRSAGAPRTPKCMQNYAERMNAKYGDGSFEYVHNIITIKYTGKHYELAGSKTVSGSDGEAEYFILTKNLIGHPSVVLPRIEEYLKKYPSGEWNRKGMLLYARVNEDIWWIHRNWSWLIYDWQLAPDEITIRAEKYRKAAIEAFKKVRGGEEGKAAKQELKLIKKNESDGKIYGIINEADVSGSPVKSGGAIPR